MKNNNRYVVDTHSLIWYFTNDTRLSKKALKALEETVQQGEIIIPTVVLAEIMYISEKGRINLNFEETLLQIARYSNFRISDLTLEVLKIANTLTAGLEMHDRLIMATAIFTKASLITKDAAISEARLVNIVW